MKAMILAGGLGTRLRPLTEDVPKSMVPVGGKPFLQHQIEQLKKNGITEIILLTGHLSEKIEQYFGDGSKFDVDITYSREPRPLGTAGAIRLARKFVDDTFLVVNGDCYFPIDLQRLIEFHKKKKVQATLALAKVKDVGRYGLVELDSDSRVLRYAEKSLSAKDTNTVSAGFYLLEPSVIDMIPEGNVSMEYDIFPKLKEFYGIAFDGYFIDIGTHETYEQFKEDAKRLLES